MEIREKPLKVLGPFGDKSDIDSIGEVIESGWWGKGPKVQEFEEKFAELVGQNITPSTKSIWYPEVQITRFMNKRYIDEEE